MAQVEIISKDLDIGVDIFSEDRIKILKIDFGIKYEEEEKCLKECVKGCGGAEEKIRCGIIKLLKGRNDLKEKNT